MDESEPTMHLDTDKGEFEATRDNAVLFRFFGKLAMYDHAFFVTDRDEGRGFYLFSTNKSFPKILDFMMEHGYEAHLNLQRVADCDLQAYDDMVENDAKDDLDRGIPDDWLNS